MKLNKEQYKIVFNSLKQEFQNYQIITDEIIKNAINCIEEEKNNFQNIPINKTQYDNINEIVEVTMQAKIIIYQLLCIKSEEDIDVLIELNDYVEKIISLYETKKKTKLPKIDIDLIIKNYQGDINFSSYIIRYIRFKLQNKEYVSISKSTEEKIVETSTEQPKKKNKKITTEEPKEELKLGTYQPTYITEVYRKLNIEIITEDKLYKDFISLRYGYLNDSYYTLEEISKILKITINQTKKYELDTIIFIKNNINNHINSIKLHLKQD